MNQYLRYRKTIGSINRIYNYNNNVNGRLGASFFISSLNKPVSFPFYLPKCDINAIWNQHTNSEFVTNNPDVTMETMTPNPYVIHIPTLTGADGYNELKYFYATRFINKNPPDTNLVVVSHTVGKTTIVDEYIFSCTHTVEMPWMLPGIEPTNKYFKIPLVVIVQFEGCKIANEHIYWDQSSVLVQLGLLDPAGLPIVGVQQATKLLELVNSHR